jgi:hypothetical protein
LTREASGRGMTAPSVMHEARRCLATARTVAVQSRVGIDETALRGQAPFRGQQE